MIQNARRLPLGIQSFEDVRTGGFAYVDKTEFIHSLATGGKAYFLCRPRRFGKSLLLSTIEAYFLGRRDLFRGLAIERLEAARADAWKPHAVLRFDFNGQNYHRDTALMDAIDANLRQWEALYCPGAGAASAPLETRFARVIEGAYKKTGRKVVVLVDEYDKPLLEALEMNAQLEAANRAVFKGVFGQLKNMDSYLRFVLVTGVTKCTRLSIFSDMNQLTDISLDEAYAAICGLTQAELEANFQAEIGAMAQKNGMTRTECLSELRIMYSGYRFSGGAEPLYNPFSIENALSKNKFGSFWFESASPEFLIKKLDAVHYDVRRFVETVKVSEAQLLDYRPENPDPIPLFYQSGYLSIHDWNRRQLSYMLGFPTMEVRYGFLSALVPGYLKFQNAIDPFNIDLLDDAVEAGDTNKIRDWFTGAFSALPYIVGDAPVERNFQNLVFMAFALLAKYARTTVESSPRCAVCTAEAADYVYLFEFRRDAPARDALAHLESGGYARPYAADPRALLKVGVSFSTVERAIVQWNVG